MDMIENKHKHNLPQLNTKITPQLHHTHHSHPHQQTHNKNQHQAHPLTEPKRQGNSEENRKNNNNNLAGNPVLYLLLLNFSPVCCIVNISSPGAASSGGVMSLNGWPCRRGMGQVWGKIRRKYGGKKWAALCWLRTSTSVLFLWLPLISPVFSFFNVFSLV